MITRNDITITRVNNKLIATHNEWTSGEGKERTINRRINAYILQSNQKERARLKQAEYEKAPKKICPRCKGQGSLASMIHVAHGICFKCGGTGLVIK